MRNLLLPFATIALVVGAAGCMTPDESTDLDSRGDSATPEFVVIDGATYECDDTLDGDGICDGYELNEGNAGDGTAQTVTASGSTMSVGGHTYTCDNVDQVDADVVDDTNTAGRCERYDRDE